MEQSKILVVTDTTSGWNEADAQKAGVALVALSVLLDDKEYKDQIEMRANELYAAQAEGKLPTTSQPNPGYLENCMKQWKEAHYDAIIVRVAAVYQAPIRAFGLRQNHLRWMKCM